MTRTPPAGYRYGPTRIEVRTDDLDAALWLNEFLVPWFETCESGPWDHCVRFTASNTAFAALERAAARSALQPIGGFALDRDVLDLRGWREAEVWHLFEAERGCFYRVQKNEVDVIARPGNRSARLALMRTVREIAATRARRLPGWIDLHAAAFAVEGRALILVGPKEAGKTTLLVHALGGLGAGCIANDRVFVEAGADPVSVRGMPTAVRVRPGTLARNPRLRDPDRPGERPLLHHRQEIREPVWPPVAALTLSPAELARRLEVRCVARMPVAAVIGVEIDGSCSGWSLEPIGAEGASAVLRGGLYGGDGTRAPTIFERSLGAVAPVTRFASVERLATALPVLRCRLGPDAYEVTTAGPTLLDALLERVALEGR